MSYLHALRLTCAGRFQAAVSTVNNDPTHFANRQAHYLKDHFNYAYTNLLRSLHLTFNGQPAESIRPSPSCTRCVNSRWP